MIIILQGSRPEEQEFFMGFAESVSPVTQVHFNFLMDDLSLVNDFADTRGARSIHGLCYACKSSHLGDPYKICPWTIYQ